MNTLGVSGGNGSDVSLDATRPTSTVTSDNSISLQISSFKLNGQNLLSWSRFVQLVIHGKGKFGYLDGSLLKPDSFDPSFLAWDINNSMVMSWLINSMDNLIAFFIHPLKPDAVTLA